MKKKILLIGFSCLLVIMIVTALFGKKGVMELRRSRRILARRAETIRALEEEKIRLEAEIRAARAGPPGRRETGPGEAGPRRARREGRRRPRSAGRQDQEVDGPVRQSRGRPEERALVDDLNPAQRRAVLHGRGPLLIIAGAGTGKTKVITHRIARLIAAKAARPNEILAVTFTEKAANEMEARVDCLVPYTSSFAEISTFNSFGERVLRDYALDVGYRPDFRLLADVDQAVFFRENLFRLPLDYYRPLGQPTRHIQEVLEAIRRLKQEDVRPEDYVGYAEGLAGRAATEAEKETARKHLEIARVFAAYQSPPPGRRASSTSRTR